MAAHIGISSTYGVTLPAGAVAQSAEKNSSIEVSEVISVSGEYSKADPLKTAKVEVSISGVGPADLTTVASGTVADPSTMTVIDVEQTENQKGRAGFSIKATGHEAFTDGSGSVTETGAPDIDTIEIVSVSYACVETLKKSRSVTDNVLTGSNGEPLHRAKTKKKGAFDIVGRGDLPAGVALGTGGADISLSGGKLIATALKENQKMDDWNGWGVSGSHYPVAA